MKKIQTQEKLKKCGYAILKCVLMVLFVSPSVTSCFDDSDIWDRIETIEERLDSLETGLNNQIKAFSDFLADEGITISECKLNADGSYSISLSNGTSFKMLPESADFSALVSYVEVDGVKYWAYYDTDGKLVPLVGADGSKVPVLTAAPVVEERDGVYYLILGDKEFVTGYTTEDVVSIFTSCQLNKDDAGQVYSATFTFGEDMSFTVAVDGYAGVKFYAPDGEEISECYVPYGRTVDILLKAPGVVDYVIDEPQGWTVVEREDAVSGEDYLMITAPTKEQVVGSVNVTMKVVAVLECGKAMVASLRLMTEPVEVTMTDALAKIALMTDYPCGPAPAYRKPDLTVYTADDMMKIPGILAEGKTKYVVLAADVDMKDKSWIPFNTEANYTKGLEFNGQGHTIKNFTCKSGAYRSFYGVMNGKMYGVTFENAVIDGTDKSDGSKGTQPAAVVAAYAGNTAGDGSHAYIYDVKITGDSKVKANGSGVGGIVGVAVNCIIKRCSADIVIENGNRQTGGIVGYHKVGAAGNYLRIEDCCSSGSVSGEQQVGGIIGQTQYETGSSRYSVGSSVIRNCYSTMKVKAKWSAGGISGSCSYGKAYAVDDISVTKDVVAGCIAWNDEIRATNTRTTNYSSGAVVAFCNIYQYFVDNYRKPDMTFDVPVDQTDEDGNLQAADAFRIEPYDQANSGDPITLTLVGDMCPVPYLYSYPYHGKVAPDGSTVSSLAKTLGWDENVWDLSGALPVLKNDIPPALDVPGQGEGDQDGMMTVRFVSYNVGCFKKYKTALGHFSYPEVAEVLKENRAAVVGLNETDNGAERTDYDYQAQELAEQMGEGWTYYFAPARSITYGNGIIASPSYKVVKEWPKLTIPKMDPNTSEVRSMGAVEYEDFVFCVTHLDHRSEASRLEGVRLITEWAKANYGAGKSNKPVILLGDMNCVPTDAPIIEFEKDWDWVSANELTFPCIEGQPLTKCIDFVFVLKNGAQYTVGESRAIHSAASTNIYQAADHYPIYVDLTFNKHN